MGVIDLPFDDRDGVIWLDGGLVEWRQAKLHVLHHGLHYASCVFEGERLYEGKIYAIWEHAERLRRSAQILGFDLPYSLGEINAAKYEVSRRQSITNGYVRTIAWRGGEQMGVAAQNSSVRLAVAVWDWGSYFSKDAISLVTAKWRRPPANSAPVQSKSSGLYMICTIAKHEANQQGYDDALMLDCRDQVAESTGSNIFLVQDGCLHTPVPECFLNGITRQTVIQLAQSNGIEVQERSILPQEFTRTQEVFVTGTAAEVTAVGQIDDHHFEIGPITRLLQEQYQSHVRSWVTEIN